MSTLDTVAPFISAPWVDSHGQPLRVRPLPGLRSDLLQALQFSASGLSEEYRELLGYCSGLAGTALGHIDFTGCWFPEERCTVFEPCLTLAVDHAGRRWITEVSEDGLPGSVWCLFTKPEVAVYVSDSFTEFLSTLWQRTRHGRLFSWLQDLTAQAHAIWAHRRSLALRRNQAEADPAIAPWLATLPEHAYIYDLRSPMVARGWPYGLAGPAGRLYRYQREAVFAVAVPDSEGPQVRDVEITRSPSVGPRCDGTVISLPVPRIERVVDTSRRGRFEERLCA